MFSIDELQSDDFLELSANAQILYVQLSLNADDDGFTSRLKMTQRLCGAGTDDINDLKKYGFIHIFKSGVSVIMNWNANNQIKKDRYHETTHKDEKEQLILNDSGWYKLKEKPNYNLHGYKMDTDWIQNGSNMDTQVVKKGSLGSEVKEVKNSVDEIGKDSLKGEPSKTKNQKQSSIPDELIKKVLLHNGNDVNKTALEFIDSEIDISGMSDKIHRIHDEIENKKKEPKKNKLDEVLNGIE